MTIIDPHAHTLHSDGTDTPYGLLRAAKDAGVDVVGITDHDTFAGWVEAEEAAVAHGVGLIRGVEVSAQWKGRPVHVLALLPDPQDAAMLEAFEQTRSSRKNRLRKMVQNLSVEFPDLTWENVERRAAGAPLGRPHLADELVTLGHTADRSQAFEWILHPHGPYYERQFCMDPVDVVKMIRVAGGVPVFAHPQASSRGRTIPEDIVAEMVDAGLFALERDHRDHTVADRAEVDRLAKLFGLPVTGGSDYHGAGKPNRLAENTTDPSLIHEIEEQGFIEVIRP